MRSCCHSVSLAYAANNQIYLHLRDQLEPSLVRGTSSGVANAPRSPFFSYNGEWLGFWADGQLKKVSVSGGAPVMVTTAANPWGASWGADDMPVK